MNRKLHDKKSLLVTVSGTIVFLTLMSGITMAHGFKLKAESVKTIKLPEPLLDGEMSVERVLQKRRSIREYRDAPLTLKEVSQLLWSAQGITGSYGMRTAPSAGALYPLKIYLVAGNVKELPGGIYRYRPEKHELEKVVEGDLRRKLAAAALGQECVRDGAVSIVIAALYERTTIKYGQRGIKYVHMEVGNVSQNIYLQSVSLNLGTVFVGAFDDERVKRVLHMPADEQPLGIMPIGRVR